MHWRRWFALEEPPREASVLAIVIAILVYVTWILVMWSWFPTSPTLARVEHATMGIIQLTLIAGAVSLVLSCAAIVGVGRLQLRDVGLAWRPVLAGMALVAALWCVAQVALAVVALASGHGLVWAASARPEAASDMLAQVAGNALAEEVVFRGFLLVQLALVARRFVPRSAAWMIAVIASTTIFALTHIPQRWIMHDMHGLALWENLGRVAWLGAIFCVIYMRTGNLGVAVALHGLANVKIGLVESPLHITRATDVLALAMLVAWPALARRWPVLGASTSPRRPT